MLLFLRHFCLLFNNNSVSNNNNNNNNNSYDNNNFNRSSFPYSSFTFVPFFGNQLFQLLCFINILILVRPGSQYVSGFKFLVKLYLAIKSVQHS